MRSAAGRVAAPLLLCVAVSARAEQPLDAGRYVEIVKRGNPARAQALALEDSARAESKASRQIPDPVLEYSRGRATAFAEMRGASGTESGYSVSQTIPWPGTLSAGIRAADLAAEALRAEATGVQWELEAIARATFARLQASRDLLAIARESELDARSLRDLVTRRTELGESRESDRIKASVEWLRQQRALAAAQREAYTAESILRTLAGEPLPRPLEIVRTSQPPMPLLDIQAAAAALADRNPSLRAGRADVGRQDAMLSVARRSRIPDLEFTAFRERELDKDSSGLSFAMRIPLWNAKRGEIARAEAAARLSSAAAQRLRLELQSELQARLTELQIAGDQAGLLEREILPAATRAVELVRLSYTEGETSLLDLLDAQRTLRDAQREAVQAQLALALALGETQKLVGPDFDPWRDR